MRVVFVRQAKVADIVGTIHGLPQRAEHDRLQQLRIGAGLDAVQQQGIILGGRIVPTAKTDAELLEEVAQGLEFLRRRTLMNPVQARLPVALEKSRSTDIGSQHALLDQSVRVVAAHRNDVLDLALRVEQHHRLDGFEVDRTALAACLAEDLEQGVERLQMRLQKPVNIALRLRHTVQPVPDLFIGQPRVRAENRRIETVVGDFAGVVDSHVANHRQAVDVGVQRTQTVGKLLRQHRNHPAREIDRVATLAGVTIKCRARLYVVTDVRDGHQQTPSASIFLRENRIIEILCRFSVNGHQRQGPQVRAAFPIAGYQRLRQGIGFCKRPGRELEWQVMLAQGDLDLHAGVCIVAEHLDDAPDRL